MCYMLIVLCNNKKSKIDLNKNKLNEISHCMCDIELTTSVIFQEQQLLLFIEQEKITTFSYNNNNNKTPHFPVTITKISPFPPMPTKYCPFINNNKNTTLSTTNNIISSFLIAIRNITLSDINRTSPVPLTTTYTTIFINNK